MRMMIDFRLPLEPFNSLVKSGTAGQKILEILEDLKPEAVYFHSPQRPARWHDDRGSGRSVEDSVRCGTAFPDLQREGGVPCRHGSGRSRARRARRAGQEVGLVS